MALKKATQAVISPNICTTDTTQTITGVKTFSQPISGSITGNAATATSATSATNATNATNATSAITATNAGTSSSCTGNSATATKLATARNINGVPFDGTQNITIQASGVNVAKAWVNFDGTGSNLTNQTIRSSYNVASVYKTATGIYEINFAISMNDVNYVFSGFAKASGSGNCPSVSRAAADSTTSKLTIQVGDSDASDSSVIGIIVFGN